jgi:hypothetical protein
MTADERFEEGRDALAVRQQLSWSLFCGMALPTTRPDGKPTTPQRRPRSTLASTQHRRTGGPPGSTNGHPIVGTAASPPVQT